MPRISLHLHPHFAEAATCSAKFGPDGTPGDWPLDLAAFTRFMLALDGERAAPGALLAAPRFRLDAVLCLTARSDATDRPAPGHRIALIWAGRAGRGADWFGQLAQWPGRADLLATVWALPRLAPPR